MNQAIPQPSRLSRLSRLSRSRTQKRVAAQHVKRVATISKSTKRAERILSTVLVGCLAYIFYTEGAITKILELIQ